ncbi:MAG: hypothetical protein F4060_13725 [Holophagales bacterium]|nr:hypothetical protein [Holophagales bacterium]MXX61450.1 hypothetical protein [Holophagales bacterium]MYA08963.1 hypothetical protein [Holophagales bacterium]MYC09781.1 hypothetical protein [Holophagales bacterium]MYD24009.1 hypothetical protein [Holophagales bacterium]
MLYVLFEIWIWVVAAGLVGAIFGWWLRSMRAAKEVAREALLWQRRVERLRRLATGLKQMSDDEEGSRDGADR